MAIELNETSVLLRYISEWDPRDAAKTKGGYMDGFIKVPSYHGKLKMIIQTYPAADINPAVAHLHPCILHVVRIGKGKRDQELEPVPTYFHWYQEFEIENGKVFIKNRKSPELEFMSDGTPRNVPEKDEITKLKEDNTITLGRKRGELNLILLQPKQQARAKPSEATITKVLADRLATTNPSGATDPSEIEFHEKFFKRKNSKNLKRIRLRVDFFQEDDIPLGIYISPQTIVDTGNKEIGAMEFYDATPLKSCVLGGRKIIMVSEYNLDKKVLPMFQVHDSNDQHCPSLDHLLVQPDKDEINLKTQTIIFLTPRQPKLHEIEAQLKNPKIKLLAKREGDGYKGGTMFDFRYIQHVFGNCPFCDLKVDSDEHVQLPPGIEGPKPGRSKRKMNQNNTSPGTKIPRITSTAQGQSPDPGSPDSAYESASDGGQSPMSDYEPHISQEFLDHIDPLNSPEHFQPNLHTPMDVTQEFSGQDIHPTDLNHIAENLEEHLSKTWDMGYQQVEDINTDPLQDLIANLDIPNADKELVNSNVFCNGYGVDSSTILMSDNNPLLSQDTLGFNFINYGSARPVIKQNPVLLQQRNRIERDSTNNKELAKPTEYEEFPTVEDKVEKQTELKKKEKNSPESEVKPLENLPFFVFIFMLILVVMKLTTENLGMGLSPYIATAVSMAFTFLWMFIWKRPMTA